MKLAKAYTTNLKKQAIDMTLSVNPLGSSPLVLKAIKAMKSADISAYPDQSNLISLLAKRFTVPLDSILLGAGSEQLIKLSCQTFLRRGDTVVVEKGSFFLFSREPALAGAEVELTEITVSRIKAKKPALLFIANPTTPGGIDRTNAELLGAIQNLRPAVAVIDEANGEFRKESLIPETQKRKDLLILRTFSKALGLAGLRLGFAIGDAQLIARLKEFQQPFPVTSVALEAAKTALNDTKFLNKTRAFVSSESSFLKVQLKKRGFIVSRSVTNNVFVSRPENRRIIGELARRGVGVIDGSFFPGNSQPGFRISIKDRKTNRLFLAKLDETLACLRSKKLLRSREVL